MSDEKLFAYENCLKEMEVILKNPNKEYDEYTSSRNELVKIIIDYMGARDNLLAYLCHFHEEYGSKSISRDSILREIIEEDKAVNAYIKAYWSYLELRDFRY